MVFRWDLFFTDQSINSINLKTFVQYVLPTYIPVKWYQQKSFSSGKPLGPRTYFFENQLIEFNYLNNFCSILFNKIFTNKVINLTFQACGRFFKIWLIEFTNQPIGSRRGMKIGNLRRDERLEKSTYIKSVGRCLLINQQLELNNKLCLCHRKKMESIYTHILSTYTENDSTSKSFSGIDSMYE